MFTTTQQLQELRDTPQVPNPSAESFNATSPIRETLCSRVIGDVGVTDKSNFVKPSMSGTTRVFVISNTGKPLTPCKESKARKLISGSVAKPIWNKFRQMGIQMLVETRTKTPETVIGIDNGSKFEGYSVISGTENILNVMWLLPDKKHLVRKLDERKTLRRTRRERNCRRRPSRFDNRGRDNFIAPSQLMMVNSRLKPIKELFKCYPINRVGVEDVRFNHSQHKWGRNFSTVEIGKNMIYDYIKSKSRLILFRGTQTKTIRESLGLKKVVNKSREEFGSHCVDSFAIASAVLDKVVKPNFNIKVIDDTYRSVRRQLHDTNFSKGGKRPKYSTGNFKGVRKGTICELGQIVGGNDNYYYIRNNKNKRIEKVITKINWLSKGFKIKNVA